MFIDTVHLLLQCGDGGKGCDSFYHRTDRKAIPDGGDGGDGGSVIIRATLSAPPIASFSFKQHLIAESGAHGGSTKKRGRNGKELHLLVPLKTRIFDRERKFLIRELVKEGDEVIILKGGRGGSGNQGGKPSSEGEKGKTLDVEFQVRLQADVFMIGLPNSGKTSLLNILTRKRLKEEIYPFSTKIPEIAVYQKSEYEQLTLCELPSLYQFSHEGRGRGNGFLKHLEDAQLVFYVIAPVTDFAGSLEEGFDLLRQQLSMFDAKLIEAPCVVIVNKKDLLDSKACREFSKKHPELKVFFVSTKSGEGIPELKDYLNEKIKGIVYQTRVQ
ncbi:MAG: hypothetical protein EXS63_04990 [Candidatus Omnitrophica bacterium]|nr:hypothetical protein [Candidatus Omnitrophota bacterium]